MLLLYQMNEHILYFRTKNPLRFLMINLERQFKGSANFSYAYSLSLLFSLFPRNQAKAT